MLYVHVYTTQNLRYNNYGAPWWTIFGDELSESRCDVGLSVRCFCLRSSKIDVSTFEDQGSMFRPSKIIIIATHAVYTNVLVPVPTCVNQDVAIFRGCEGASFQETKAIK